MIPFLLPFLVGGASIGAAAITSGTEETVTGPVPGSVLYCGLVGPLAEHSGIYVGKGAIAHLDGKGKIELVSPFGFLERLGGLSTGRTIYVSCHKGRAVGSKKASEFARSLVGKEREYNFILDNCHQFVSGCLSKNPENSHNFLWMLKDEAARRIRASQWLEWKRVGGHHIELDSFEPHERVAELRRLSKDFAKSRVSAERRRKEDDSRFMRKMVEGFRNYEEQFSRAADELEASLATQSTRTKRKGVKA